MSLDPIPRLDIDISLTKKVLSEFIGTFLLVLIGTGAIVYSQEISSNLGNFEISLAFGLIVALMVYSFGNISGAHINPAVSFAFAISGHLKKAELPFYLVAQLAGAFSASFILSELFPNNKFLGGTILNTSLLHGIGFETLWTSILMGVIYVFSSGPRSLKPFAGLAIGFTIFMASMIIGPLTGASLNPARSLGPALVSGYTAHLWLFVLIPIIGASLATPLYNLILKK